MQRLRSELRRLRQERRLTQEELASRIGLSRQSLNNIEMGRSVPSTEIALRAAEVLGCRVEDLFQLAEAAPTLEAELAADALKAPAGRKRRVVVASVGGRWIAHPLGLGEPEADPLSADGLVRDSAASSAVVHLLEDARALRETLVCAGCAPALGVLTARTGLRAGGGRLRWLERSSSVALDLLRRRQVHLAGAHLFDESSGEFNVPFARRLGQSVRIVTLARWEAGLVVPQGNPRRIKRVADLAQPHLWVAAREAGSGAQLLLERLCRRGRVPLSSLHFRGSPARGHMDAARRVAFGVADAAVAIHSAALALGLDFVPLAEERFDLFVPQDIATDPRVTRLLDTLAGRSFRRELQSIGGYAVGDSGRLIADIAA